MVIGFNCIYYERPGPAQAIVYWSRVWGVERVRQEGNFVAPCNKLLTNRALTKVLKTWMCSGSGKSLMFPVANLYLHRRAEFLSGKPRLVAVKQLCFLQYKSGIDCHTPSV